MSKRDVRLESERLILRQARGNDAVSLAAFFRRNRKFHGRTERPESFYTAAFWKKQIARERQDYRADRGITLYLFLRENPREPVGEVIFDQIVRRSFQSCFLGYLLGEAHEGKGYMTEALKAAMPFAFGPMNLHRVSAAHAPRNRKSCRVLEKLGFHVAGFERRYLRINGRWQDHEVHVLLNDRWKAP